MTPLMDIPFYPAWGKSFASGGFKWALWEALQLYPDAKKVILFCAGNDLSKDDPDPKAIAGEMQGLKYYWSQWGVELMIIDIIPRPYHQR